MQAMNVEIRLGGFVGTSKADRSDRRQGSILKCLIRQAGWVILLGLSHLFHLTILQQHRDEYENGDVRIFGSTLYTCHGT